jgi:23S rRNA (cytosine1962-C5)-methyltransferase
MATLFLKPGRDRSAQQRHPWVFSGAVDRLKGQAASGETIEVRSAEGEWLGVAAYSPASKISARFWSWNPDEVIDEAFLRARIRSAIALRQALVGANEGNALRLVHAESDGLPGLVVDRYNRRLVVQILNAGAEYWREKIADILMQETGIEDIFERSDVDVRGLEGLAERCGPLRGSMPEGPEMIEENQLKYWVDIRSGQKTGFYLDQRANRLRLRDFVKGRSLLNCFCYTGGFSLNAVLGGASEIVSVDSSAEALEAAKNNAALNQFEQPMEWVEEDVFFYLRGLRDRGRKFDAIILDPPKFAPTSAQAERAARGYKDINLLAFKLLKPGGLLFTFSCSGGINAELFEKIVAGAALDAKVEARVLQHLEQGLDHPTALNFPEGKYLKGLICQVAG